MVKNYKNIYYYRYFRPLELWLRVQNREEQIIGWNSNFQDVALFAPQKAASNKNLFCTGLLILVCMFVYV